MNTDRLARLKLLLEEDAANPTGVKFALKGWARDTTREPVSSFELYRSYPPLATKAVPVSCDTAACAIGLAAISGVFKEEGLDWRITDAGVLVPTFEGWQNWDAVTRFFGINISQAYELFNETDYPPDQQEGAVAELAVANRIGALLNSAPQ